MTSSLQQSNTNSTTAPMDLSTNSKVSAPISLQQQHHPSSNELSLLPALFKQLVPFLDIALASHACQVGPGSSLAIGDFGCGPSSNSYNATNCLVKMFRAKYGQERSIMIYQNDLPTQAWSQFFNESARDYPAVEGVFRAAIARSFYERCLPDESLDLALSVCAVHWLSRCPMSLANHCYPAWGSDEEIAAYQQQAASDWETFLLQRSAELKPGGILVCHLPGGGFYNVAAYACEALYKACLRVRPPLDNYELVNFNIPFYYRSSNEIVSIDLYAKFNFELVKVGILTLPVVSAETTQPDVVLRDTFWPVFGKIFRAALNTTRSAEEIEAICSKVSEYFLEEIRIIDLPTRARNDSHAMIVLRKMS